MTGHAILTAGIAAVMIGATSISAAQYGSSARADGDADIEQGAVEGTNLARELMQQYSTDDQRQQERNQAMQDEILSDPAHQRMFKIFRLLRDHSEEALDQALENSEMERGMK